ncbi:MAG: efflux RND transporter periplasmic adaptor subunit [Chthoniobacterales bacterium]|nr:efflux RND transporter periplasmic adaptor subunit [Chthoniobacterales bacterium]
MTGLLAVVICGGLVMGCGQKKSPALPKRPPQDVGVVTLKPERVEVVTELPGRTSSYRVAEVRPQVGGVILRRLYEEGGDVKEGDQLYQIDPARYEAAYESAKASVAKAEAAAEVAKLVVERRSKLAATSVISKQDYDDVVAVEKQTQASVAEARADLEKARIDLEYTKVLAPISGRIGRSAVTEGALVTPGQTAPLATVHQLDPIYVDVTQSSVQLLKLRRQMEEGALQGVENHQAVVKLLLEDGSTYAHAGKLQFSEVSVDQGTGSVTLRAVFPNPEQELLPGMFVRAKIIEGVNEKGILVPQRGVTRNAKGQAVALVVTPEDVVEIRVVEADRSVGDRWLVTKGLVEGDRVIVEGLQKTAPGAKVKPTEMAPAKEGA